MNVPPAVEVRLDLFPAESPELSELLPEVPADKPLRVIATDSHLVVYAEVPGRKSGPEGPEPTMVFGLRQFNGRPRDGYLAVTTGGTFYIKRMRHCGCGSMLRIPRPYPGVPYIISNTPLPTSLYVGEDTSNASGVSGNDS